MNAVRGARAGDVAMLLLCLALSAAHAVAAGRAAGGGQGGEPCELEGTCDHVQHGDEFAGVPPPPPPPHAQTREREGGTAGEAKQGTCVRVDKVDFEDHLPKDGFSLAKWQDDQPGRQQILRSQYTWTLCRVQGMGSDFREFWQGAGASRRRLSGAAACGSGAGPAWWSSVITTPTACTSGCSTTSPVSARPWSRTIQAPDPQKSASGRLLISKHTWALTSERFCAMATQTAFCSFSCGTSRACSRTLARRLGRRARVSCGHPPLRAYVSG
jgi:hypothetical protein